MKDPKIDMKLLFVMETWRWSIMTGYILVLRNQLKSLDIKQNYFLLKV